MSEAARKAYGSRNNYLNSGADLEGMLEARTITLLPPSSPFPPSHPPPTPIPFLPPTFRQ